MKPHILMVALPDFNIIGAQRIAIDFGQEYAKKYGLVHFCAARKGGNEFDFENYSVFGRGGVFNVRGLRIIFDLFFLLLFVRRLQPDTILSVTPFYNRALCFYKALGLYKSRLVIEDHSYPPTAFFDEFKNSFVRSFYKHTQFLYKHASALRVLSKHTQNHYKSLGISSCCFPNLLSFSRIDELSKLSSSDCDDEADIVYVGRFESQKNIAFLVEALHLLSKKIKFKANIIGYGSEFNLIKDQLIRLQLQDFVAISDSNIFNFSKIKKAKIFPLTSIWEGYPLVLIEAMRLGTAVVSVDCKTGPHELIGNNERGWLVPVNDLEKFVEALHAALSQEEERNIRVSRAYEFVSTNLCIEKNFSKYVSQFINPKP
jgi:glycosyltransferase involved in cell wall biosynthesis